MRKYTLLTILALVVMLCPGASILRGPGAGATASAFPSANLISYWKLDETSGTRVDATATGNNLTDNNTVTSNTGKIGNAGQFTAANSEYLSHTDNASLSTGDIDFTFTCWVYLDDKTDPHVIFSKFLPTGNQLEYALDYSSASDRFRFYVSPDGSTSTVVSANNLGAVSTATWYFIAVWHDSVANTINIQVNNGAVDSAAHTTGVFDSTAPFYIGARELINFHNGRIDEVAFFKRKLTTTDITTIWNGGAGLTYP